MAALVITMARKTLPALRHVASSPEQAPPSLVATIALTPAVVAGLIVYRQVALEMLAVALVAGVAAHVGARIARLPLPETPVLPALVGVALVGPRASLVWAAVVAVVACGFALGRARFTPSARVQTGILAYAVVLLVSFGAPAAYAVPGSGAPTAEPIRQWLMGLSGGQAAIDPVRLYVGNVAGPVFATSMLAVAIGAAWLWYARRLSLLIILTFLGGALAPIQAEGWAAGYQLISGPLWFCVALVLADRRTLTSSGVGRPLLGLAAGALTLGARTKGFAIEAAPVTVAAAQLLQSTGGGLRWLRSNRREVRARFRELRATALPVGRVNDPGRPVS